MSLLNGAVTEKRPRSAPRRFALGNYGAFDRDKRHRTIRLKAICTVITEFLRDDAASALVRRFYYCLFAGQQKHADLFAGGSYVVSGYGGVYGELRCAHI